MSLFKFRNEEYERKIKRLEQMLIVQGRIVHQLVDTVKDFKNRRFLELDPSIEKVRIVPIELEKETEFLFQDGVFLRDHLNVLTVDQKKV